MRTVATILCLLFISGCSGLIINEEDGAGAKIAKFTTRTVLGVGTLGMSELGVANAKRQKEFQEYLESLPPEERVFERQLYSVVPHDEALRDYIRSLSAEQRMEFLNKLIVERERQKAIEAQTKAISKAIRQSSQPQTTTTTPTPKSTTNCYTTYWGGFAQTQCN